MIPFNFLDDWRIVHQLAKKESKGRVRERMRRKIERNQKPEQDQQESVKQMTLITSSKGNAFFQRYNDRYLNNRDD